MLRLKGKVISMVLKKSKFNANTGNTLRRICSCSTKDVARYVKNNRYRTENRAKNQHKIPRQDKGITFKYRFYNDIDKDQTFLNFAGVPYSLNKRKRWLIPDDMNKEKLCHKDTIDQVHDVHKKKSSCMKQSNRIKDRKRCRSILVTTERGYSRQRHQKTWAGELDMPVHAEGRSDLNDIIGKRTGSIWPPNTEWFYGTMYFKREMNCLVNRRTFSYKDDNSDNKIETYSNYEYCGDRSVTSHTDDSYSEDGDSLYVQYRKEHEVGRRHDRKKSENRMFSVLKVYFKCKRTYLANRGSFCFKDYNDNNEDEIHCTNDYSYTKNGDCVNTKFKREHDDGHVLDGKKYRSPTFSVLKSYFKSERKFLANRRSFCDKNYKNNKNEDKMYNTDNKDHFYSKYEDGLSAESKNWYDEDHLHDRKKCENPTSSVGSEIRMHKAAKYMDTNGNRTNELGNAPLLGTVKHYSVSHNSYYDVLTGVKFRQGNDTRMVNYEVQCSVKSYKTKEEYLSGRFGNYFSEGSCTPRRFCVFDRKFFQTGVFLTAKVLMEMNEQTKVSIRIYNLDDDIAMCLDNIHNKRELPFDIVLDTCFNFDAITSYYITHVFELPTCTDSRHCCTDDNMNTKSCEVIKMEDAWFGMVNRTLINQYSSLNRFDENNCPICYTDRNITYLNSCGHYLCDACWEKYINTKVSSVCHTIICPGPECMDQLRQMFVVTYLSEDHAVPFIKKQSKIAVQHSSTMKLCPNASCMHVAPLKSSMENIVGNPSFICSCKSTRCFNCLDQDHWPSSCDANYNYNYNEQNKGDPYGDNVNYVRSIYIYQKMSIMPVSYRTGRGLR